MVSIHCFLNNFVNNVDIEPWSRLPCWRHPTTSDWRIFECVDAKKRHGTRKHLIFQKVIVPYMKDADNDILFTMKVNEMKVCTDVYGLSWHLRTRFETGTVRKTEVMAVRTI